MKPQKVLPLQNNRTKIRGEQMVCRWHIKQPQPWTWAEKHEERVQKHWRWRLREAVWDNTKAQFLRCVPLSQYGWKAFGFDGEHKPAWTIADYLKGGVE